MSNANKIRGTKYETDLVNTLGAFFSRAFGLRPRREVQHGALDTGDLHGVEPFVLQAKDDKGFAISAWLDGPKGVTVQATRAGEPYGAVVVKRRARAIGDSYTILRLADFARVLLRLRRAEALLAAADPAAYDLHAAETKADHERPFPRVSDVERA